MVVQVAVVPRVQVVVLPPLAVHPHLCRLCRCRANFVLTSTAAHGLSINH